jgi:hypothetical protein
MFSKFEIDGSETLSSSAGGDGGGCGAVVKCEFGECSNDFAEEDEGDTGLHWNALLSRLSLCNIEDELCELGLTMQERFIIAVMGGKSLPVVMW